MNARAESSGVHDPNEIGPLHVCYRCFTPEPDDFTFCQTCGRIKGFFETPLTMSGEECFCHPSVRASSYCVLCARPICKGCTEREGVSFVSGLPTPQCRACVNRSCELESKF